MEKQCVNCLESFRATHSTDKFCSQECLFAYRSAKAEERALRMESASQVIVFDSVVRSFYVEYCRMCQRQMAEHVIVKCSRCGATSEGPHVVFCECGKLLSWR